MGKQAVAECDAGVARFGQVKMDYKKRLGECNND